MTIRVLIFQKHNITRKIYSKQASFPLPSHYSILLHRKFLLPDHLPHLIHILHTAHHSVLNHQHESPIPDCSPPSTYPQSRFFSRTSLCRFSICVDPHPILMLVPSGSLPTTYVLTPFYFWAIPLFPPGYFRNACIGTNSIFNCIPIPRARRFRSFKDGFLVPFSSSLISA